MNEPAERRNNSILIVFTTTPNLEEGERLAGRIVAERLAACVQILPRMRSVYFWKGEVVSEAEHLLLIKTSEEKYEALERFLVSNHSYEVPEIVAVSAEKVSEGYAKWLSEYV